jgi:four helix bundle protein
VGHPVENLVAYRVAADVAADVFAIVVRWRPFEQHAIGKQLMRSLNSIPANIAESCGREHPKDRRRFLTVARGSYLEAEHWLKQAERQGLITEEPRRRLAEAGKALNGLIKRQGPGPKP